MPWPYDDKLVEWRNACKKRRALKKSRKTKSCYDYDGTLLNTGISEDGKKDKKSCGMMSEVFMQFSEYQIVVLAI